MLPQNTHASFEAFNQPSIKNDFCGTPAMKFQYCKCAFHGQYCDSVGMESGSANNYVQSGFNSWVGARKKEAADVCKNKGGAWKGNGCEYCDPPTFLWSGGCKSVIDLCSEDPNIKFNTEAGRCECKYGWELMNDNTCEAICPEDEPWLVYSLEEDACICGPGYEESNDGECIEAAEIKLDVKFIDAQPPYLADGKTEAIIEVNISDYETGDPMEARFDIKYSDRNKPGKIISTEKTAPGKYLLKYKTANLIEDGKPGVFDDGLYIFYYSKKEEKEIYKVQAIEVAVGVVAQAVLTKPGFEQIPVDLVFTSPETTIHFTVEEGEVLDVAGVRVEIVSNYASFTSDSEGMVTVESPQNVDSEIRNEMEITLNLTNEAKDDWVDMGRNLGKIQKITKSEMPEASALLKNFAQKLAKTSNVEEAEKLLSGTKRVKYALFFILEGEKNLKLTTKGMADSLKDQIWDVMDMANVFGRLADKLGGPIKRLIKAVGNSAGEKTGEVASNVLKPYLKDMGEWGEYFAKGIEMEGWGFYNEMSNFSKSLANKGQDIINQFASVMRYFTKASAPNFDVGWVGEFTWEMSKKYEQDGNVKNFHDKKAGYESWIQDFFLNKEKDILTELANRIDTKIAKGNWNAVHTDTDLLTAKWDYDEMMSHYRMASYTDVLITEAKAEIELVLDMVLTPLKFTGFATKAAGAAEMAYKAARTAVLNNQVFFAWADATGITSKKMMTAVNRALGEDPGYVGLVWPFAYASEVEGSPIVNQNLIKYGEATSEADFLSDLHNITVFIEKYFPDETGELKTYNEGLTQRIETAETKKKELKPLVKNELEGIDTVGCDELDENCDGEVGISDITWQEWIAMILFFGFIGIIIRWIYKKIKGKK